MVAILTAAAVLSTSGVAKAVEPPTDDDVASYIQELPTVAETQPTLQDYVGYDKDTQHADALPAIGAVVIAAAAWCARGTLATAPTTALLDIKNGKVSSKRTYVENAIIGCIGGEIGGWVWRFLTPKVKRWVINSVIAVIIRFHR
ncbi:hypothetical protein [Ornithinimicrobium cryptoxanthini]|uniref:hypothetical protein n=1 Tax=Ornithinimicrobium cryptoxanthini TaxID=2934161 RepID=UPI0021192658|nr:hypothetical protein [Ornithinimicrobium cryptoxanthini]